MKNIILALVVLLTFGCQSTKQFFTPKQAHIEKSESLNAIMIELENLIFERYYTEIERDEKRIRYTKEISTLLDDIATESKKIQATPPFKAKLSDEDAIIYMSLANELEQKVQDLRDITDSYQTEKITPTLQQMTDICNRCHAKFQ